MLHALGGILLRAIPTFLLIVLLHFYLKNVFFKPLAKVLHQRYQATEGARKAAHRSLEEAAARTAQYEAALRAAKAELYHAQEQLHKQMQEKETAVVAAAHAAAEASIKAARADLERDVAGLKLQLAAQSDAIAGQIAEKILRRSAA